MDNVNLNTAIHGDCLEIMNNFPDKCIDMVVTSPPYDNLRTYNDSLEWNFKIFKGIAKQLYRVIKDGGVIVWIVGDATIKGSETGTSFKQALYFKALGLNLHDTMIWQKKDPIPLTHNRYEQCFEYMFVFSKGKPKAFNPIMVKSVKGGLKENMINWSAKDKKQSKRIRDEVITRNAERIKHNNWLNSVNDGNIRINHPAKFPLQLATDHVLSWSNESDTVLDPFGGSGTTALACMKLNRNFILIEKEQEYIDIINARIENHQRIIDSQIFKKVE